MNDWLEKTNKSHFKFNLLGRAWRRGWWALETGSQTVYGVSLIASCSFIKIYSINMWCMCPLLCYRASFPPTSFWPKETSCFDSAVSIARYSRLPWFAQASEQILRSKVSERLEHRVVHFFVFFAFFMNTRYNHRNKEQTLKAVRSHRPLCQFPFLPPFLVWCVTFWGVNNLYTGSGLA